MCSRLVRTLVAPEGSVILLWSVQVNTQCERELRSFMRVSATRRLAMPRRSRDTTSTTAPGEGAAAAAGVFARGQNMGYATGT